MVAYKKDGGHKTYDPHLHPPSRTSLHPDAQAPPAWAASSTFPPHSPRLTQSHLCHQYSPSTTLGLTLTMPSSPKTSTLATPDLIFLYSVPYLFFDSSSITFFSSLPTTQATHLATARLATMGFGRAANPSPAVTPLTSALTTIATAPTASHAP
ncbi:unnamed protein product [Sphenostylis stenocarpa]|uniref:Uncharacterized protein n=1 Tax=Sphenostylis stenocarpa TaxID=92480 RepID=A0AA86SLP0_9FABA|nr:unnamed protein product [Sphenostylis stenocarpa]